MRTPHEDLKARLAEKAAAVRRCLNTPDGKVLLDALEQEYLYGRLLGDTPEQTAYRLGSRDVVIYLRELRSHEGNHVEG
jgi:hypothetical protein